MKIKLADWASVAEILKRVLRCATDRGLVRFITTILISMAALISASVLAHHGAVTSGFLYNADVLVEIEGELTEVLWRNPHLRARMKVVDDAGIETIC